MSYCADSGISACWLFVIASDFAFSISFRMPESVLFVAQSTSSAEMFSAEMFSELSEPEDFNECFVSLLTFLEISSNVPCNLSIFSAISFFKR